MLRCGRCPAFSYQLDASVAWPLAAAFASSSCLSFRKNCIVLPPRIYAQSLRAYQTQRLSCKNRWTLGIAMMFFVNSGVQSSVCTVRQRARCRLCTCRSACALFGRLASLCVVSPQPDAAITQPAPHLFRSAYPFDGRGALTPAPTTPIISLAFSDPSLNHFP